MEYLNNKPETVPLKEWLIRRLAVKTGTPMNILHAVIDFQGEEANKALDSRLNNNFTVEITGFGKFVFSRAKAIKRIAKYESTLKLYRLKQEEELTDVVRRNLESRIASTEEYLRILKTKLYGLQSDI